MNQETTISPVIREDRVSFLLQHPHLGPQVYASLNPRDEYRSNCLGTALHPLGLYDAPRPMYGSLNDFKKIFSEYFVPDENGFLLAFGYEFDGISFNHFGARVSKNKMVHQEGQLFPYSIKNIEEYIQEQNKLTNLEVLQLQMKSFSPKEGLHFSIKNYEIDFSNPLIKK